MRSTQFMSLVWIIWQATLAWKIVAFTSLPSRENGMETFCKRTQAHLSDPLSLFTLYASSKQQLTPLPQGISPFQKSISKTLDVQAQLRKLAKSAVDAAIISSDSTLLEIEFPPLIGGEKSKSQFDDFDNIQELDANRDWSIQFALSFLNSGNPSYQGGRTWIIFPDTKECELAKKEWAGRRYREATFTTIEAATEFGDKNYDSPWGAAFSKGVNKLFNNGPSSSSTSGSGLLGDSSSLDPLNVSPSLQIIVQPGNGGPVEDWINCEKIAFSNNNKATMVIVNGALDKVRDGFYPSLFFPKLASTVDRFYKKFESVLYLKPISDKGVYGWIFRVFPEPWQVILQSTQYRKNGDLYIDDNVVYVSEKRPSYVEALAKLLAASQARS